MFHCLNLGHLAAVQLYDGAGLEFAPFVPKVSHTDFVTEHAHPRWVPVDLFSWLNGELLVNLLFKWAPGSRIISDSEFARVRNLFIVKAALFRKSPILIAKVDKILDTNEVRGRIDHWV